jgi:DNA invertase Pin-like site-specific DNA recombinase
MIAHRGKYIAYYRVSTSQQGKSGLGLAAQKAAVRQRLDGGSWQLVGEYTEIESGKRVRRPQLEAALAAAKKHKAKLIVAKLDRLARNTHFLLTLINAGVEPLFCDLPEMNGAMGRFMLTSMAAVAELEAGLISERTKAGLAVAKARGKVLGRTGAEILAPRWAAARAVDTRDRRRTGETQGADAEGRHVAPANSYPNCRAAWLIKLMVDSPI